MINIFPLGPGKSPIYSTYFEPVQSDNHFIAASVYNDNFSSLKR